MQNLPPELREYYNDKINFKNEFDLNIALTMFAMINIDEFDKTTYQKLGRALSDQSFNFDTDRRASGHIYLLTENG